MLGTKKGRGMETRPFYVVRRQRGNGAPLALMDDIVGELARRCGRRGSSPYASLLLCEGVFCAELLCPANIFGMSVATVVFVLCIGCVVLTD